jgi:phage-related protein
MPLDLFLPPIAPAPQSARPVKPRVNEAVFGDGYSQRSEDGLNTVNRTFQAQWPLLTIEQQEAIEDFLELHTSIAFRWTPPLQSIERKWVAVDWTPGYAGADIVSLSANLKEVFDL